MSTIIRRRNWWGFRGKLALSIAVSFILLGVALVGIQLVILDQSIAATINVSVGTGNASELPTGESEVINGSSDCVQTVESTDCEISIPDDAAAADYGQTIASDVMQNYIVWSVALLIAFAAIAAVLAWFLTRSPARKISGITALAEDISEHDLSRRINMPGARDEVTELGDRIDTMLARLETAFATQDQFVANASHELRTPITAVRTALEAPMSQGRVPDELLPYLERALHSTQRMDELITALLLIARSKHLAAHEQRLLDLVELVRHEIHETRDAAEQRWLRLTTALPDSPVLVLGNEQALAIAVRNLLRNAIQHNIPEGDLTVVVEIDAECHPVLTVSNSGSIYTDTEAAELTRAFNRGRQTRIAGTPGTGLGLTIIESIANAHSARVKIDANHTGGLKVTLVFALTQAQAQ